MSACRVVLFGDPQGIPQLLPSLRVGAEVLAIVQASIRPAQLAELKAIADEVHAPLLVQPLPRAAEYTAFAESLKTLKPDLFVINSYSMILRTDLLAVPARGTVNIHGALLPQYRGANVTEWALINEERVSGATMHLVDSGIDTGPIISQVTVPISFEDTWADARQRINEATRRLLTEQMPGVLAGRYSATPQGEGQHWQRRSARDGRFEWRQPLRQIYNLVRSLVAPHPGASWESPDGTNGTLDRWTSLAELAALKAKQIGDWRYGEVVLSPKPATSEEQRKLANASIAFDVKGTQGAFLGSATLRGIDCYAGSARAELLGFATIADGLTAALAEFLREELQIVRLERVEVPH